MTVSNNTPVSGRFLTLEGGEGVGKSTNIQFITQLLKKRGIDCLVTREPGGTELAEKIRELLLSDHSEPVGELTELLLVFAARAQHLQQKIKPALAAGKWVLCDRFTDATFAYQGAGRGLNRDVIAALEALVQGELRPDLTVLLDIDPAIGLARAGQCGTPDRFEKEKLTFFERVRKGYQERADAEPGRFLVIDASAPLSEVQEEIERRLLLSLNLSDQP
ncbi:dTMP kinase [Pseudohongiella nitratireducens]|uniref:dTMP kinase n=1 Tax=Pseudohongiella nitratireducens TaxID=1768907 RepID=UPI00240A648D|nr:dTMP kinase [Pseudohongiella nitratireducens]MDF1623913.1 dTMP kinase [Pseudohongiella nitratireducens]|tara:strand:- start:5956 stop:6615 length:660 start_codon:yes stop_codon:yes gene_type:complete